MATPKNPKYHKVSKQVQQQYKDQVKSLEVTFVCNDGQIRCDRRQLRHSDYFWDVTGKMKEFGNDLKFDYTNYSLASVLGSQAFRKIEHLFLLVALF